MDAFIPGAPAAPETRARMNLESRLVLASPLQPAPFSCLNVPGSARPRRNGSPRCLRNNFPASCGFTAAGPWSEGFYAGVRKKVRQKVPGIQTRHEVFTSKSSHGFQVKLQLLLAG